MKYWLNDKIRHILKAKGVADDFQTAELIELIAEDELYELWIKWMDEQDATWKSKNKKSFIIWLKNVT